MRFNYKLVLLIMLVSVINAGAQPFDVTTVLSVPQLTPGDRNIGLEFTIQNNQDVPIGNVKAYLFLRYPFSASISPNNKLGEISYPGYLISTGGSGDEYTPYFDLPPKMSRKTFFKIDIDRSANYGEYDLPYTIYYDNKEYNGKITLTIKGNTLIEIKNVSVASNNSQVEPGEVFKIQVSFENVGDNEIKWLKLSLNPKDKTLIPLSSDSEMIFRDIPHGSIRDSEVWFSLEKNAAVKNYPIDLELTYLDERGIEFNETKLVGIVASGRANMDIAKKTTEPAVIVENNPFTLTLKIENTGTGDAKGVIARLDSTLIGDDLAYLGEIKKDDYSNALFMFDPDGSGKKSGILHIIYEDDFGKHDVQKEINIVVNPAQGGNLLPVLIGIIVIVIIVIFLKRRKP
ncbi:MAG: hypothetical protein OIN87_01690 [Candidatus Methanoperedens sp.]|nr:hypothetical protein [Candidatus Methanoperedens sp.]